VINIELTFTKGKITRELNGDYNIMLVVPKQEQSSMEPLNGLLNDDKLKACTIEHKKKKRSLNANAYAWALLTKIADVLRSSKEEVYFLMLKRYGQSTLVSIEDKVNEFGERIVDIFKKAIKYHEELGRSELNGKDFVHIKVYMGSSEFDTKQMAIFIDGIVSEAKELNISTMAPREIEQLKERWGR